MKVMIGASTLITMIVITGVLTYYNTARAMVKEVGSGYDFDSNYSSYVQEVLLKTISNGDITGTDVINILNYFYEDPFTDVSVLNVVPIGISYDYSSISGVSMPTGTSKENYNNANKLELNLFNKLKQQINPSAKFTISRTTSGDKLILVLTQN